MTAGCRLATTVAVVLATGVTGCRRDDPDEAIAAHGPSKARASELRDIEFGKPGWKKKLAEVQKKTAERLGIEERKQKRKLAREKEELALAGPVEPETPLPVLEVVEKGPPPTVPPAPVVSTIPGSALREWLGTREVRGPSIFAKDVPAEVTAEVEALMAGGVGTGAELSWIRLMAPAKNGSGPTVAVAVRHGARPAPGGQSVAVTLAAVADENGEYTLRTFAGSRKGPNDHWSLLADRDIDDDDVPDTVVRYQSTEGRTTKEGLIVLRTFVPSASKVALTRYTENGEETLIRSACWTLIDRLPTLLVLRETVGRGSNDGRHDRYEARAFRAGHYGRITPIELFAGVYASDPSVEDLERDLFEATSQSQAKARFDNVRDPAVCFGRTNPVFVVPASTIRVAEGGGRIVGHELLLHAFTAGLEETKRLVGKRRPRPAAKSEEQESDVGTIVAIAPR